MSEFMEIFEERKQKLDDFEKDIQALEEELKETDSKLDQVSNAFKADDLEAQRKLHNEREFLSDALERAKTVYKETNKKDTEMIPDDLKIYLDNVENSVNADEDVLKDKELIKDGISMAKQAIARLKQKERQADARRKKATNEAVELILNRYREQGYTEKQIMQIKTRNLYEMGDIHSIQLSSVFSRGDFSIIRGVPSDKQLGVNGLVKE